MAETGNKVQLRHKIELQGIPNQAENPAEKSRWKAFLKWINPWASEGKKLLKTAKQLGIEHVDAQNSKVRAEAEHEKAQAAKVMAEASEYAAKADLLRLEKVKAENAEIANLFLRQDLSDEAKMLMLTNLIKDNPEIEAQVQKIMDLKAKLRAVHFAEVTIEIKVLKE